MEVKGREENSILNVPNILQLKGTVKFVKSQSVVKTNNLTTKMSWVPGKTDGSSNSSECSLITLIRDYKSLQPTTRLPVCRSVSVSP